VSEAAQRLAQVSERMRAAAVRAGRDPLEVRVLAVSKAHPAESVAELARHGARAFGENRLQEAEAKIARVRELAAPGPPRWHCIGHLQRNKARRAARLFDVIETLDRAELADALERAAHEANRSLEVLLQINIDTEPQKSGVAPADAAALARHVAQACPHLALRGVMAIPRAVDDPADARASFARMRELRDALRADVSDAIAELSMGMSHDFEVAIEEGATWIRIGTALFGERTAR
jgi:PLP dependent protein